MGMPENIAHMGEDAGSYMDFQLTREGNPPLDELIVKLMENYDFFSDMDRKEIICILRLCGRRSFKPGQIIFESGDVGNCFYIIIFGKVIIRSGEKELARLEQGQCFGEMAVLDNAPRVATAEAAKNTLLFSVGREILADALPSLGFKIASHLARQLSQKLRESNRAANEISGDAIIN